MAGEMIFRCAVCGAIKGEANKWLLGRVVRSPFAGYTLGPWNANKATLPGVDVLCGDNCAHKRQAPFVRTEQIPNPTEAPKRIGLIGWGPAIEEMDTSGELSAGLDGILDDPKENIEATEEVN